MTPVPLFDPTRLLTQTPGLKQALERAFHDVLSSGQYILGPKTAAFEEEMRRLLGAPSALGVSSGTDALLLALMAAGIGPGDAVICPSFTFFATAGVIARVGATPIFVDSCPGCFNMLPSALERARVRSEMPVRAVIAVHLFGQMADIVSIVSWARPHQILVIEDAAQAMGASLDGKQAGTFGDFGCFSFFPTKNIGALGDAGLVTARAPDHATKLATLRVHGARKNYLHEQVGGNFRIDALQAACLSVKLPWFTKSLAARRENAARYDEALAQAPDVAQDACICSEAPAKPRPLEVSMALPGAARGAHTYNQYVVRIGRGRRESIRRCLSDDGIGHAVYYPVPLHAQPCFQSGKPAEAQCGQATLLASEVIALPIFPELLESEQQRVISCLLTALERG